MTPIQAPGIAVLDFEQQSLAEEPQGLTEELCDGISTHTESPEMCSVEVQTDFVLSDIDNLHKELAAINHDKYVLRAKISAMELNKEGFKGNENKVNFYTGLPTYALLLFVLHEIAPFLNVTATSSLNKFQQLLLTMMKLRLNLKFVDLGYRFRISHVTASRIFHQTLNILYRCMYRYVVWPEREELHRTMPVSFKEAFGNSVAIIIDCFEVFTERASNLKARCQTWSAYKHHNTVKFLIGICPQGVVSFVSEGWGGRASDKHITENCGILKKLLPGDTVLADRGFNIANEVSIYYATVQIPAFTKGKAQLDPKDVEETRKIASVRIHVERVIGTLRQKYQILFGNLPIEML